MPNQTHVKREIPLKMSRAQISRGDSEACHNPVCGSPVASSRRRPKLSCSDRCRQERSILNRAAKLLLPLGPAMGWKILEDLKNGDSQVKAGGEIVNLGAI